MARSPRSARDLAPPDPARKRRIGDPALVWRHATRYRWRIAAAWAALVTTSAATLAIPYGFKRVIDRVVSGPVTRARSRPRSIIC